MVISSTPWLIVIVCVQLIWNPWKPKGQVSKHVAPPYAGWCACMDSVVALASSKGAAIDTSICMWRMSWFIEDRFLVMTWVALVTPQSPPHDPRRSKSTPKNMNCCVEIERANRMARGPHVWWGAKRKHGRLIVSCAWAARLMLTNVVLSRP